MTGRPPNWTAESGTKTATPGSRAVRAACAVRTTFTPVINAPQVAILGVGATVLRPQRQGDGVVYRDMMALSLTLDHRIVDGAPGARFLQTLTGILENFDLVCVAG